ncbi:MAG: leucine-rich repeat domain-containing protein, partial [Duncaniella sp.]|nr:leucine-rich repeat domain-containing protein [Duncaniella sp.]
MAVAGYLPSSAAYTYEFHDDGTCTLMSVGSETSVGIGDFITGYDDINYKITAVDPKAFKDSPDLEYVSFGRYITSIPDGLFENCSKLTGVRHLGTPALTTIGARAFKGCSALTAFSIPATVTSIGDEAFQGCSALEGVSISGDMTYIGKRAFSDCSSLRYIVFQKQEIYVPLSRVIGSQAFSGCTNLEFVSFDSSYYFDCPTDLFSEEVYDSAILYYPKGYGPSEPFSNFQNRENIEEAPVRLKFAVKDIAKTAEVTGYEGYKPHGEVVIPAEYGGYPVVRVDGFKDCTNITSVTIPESVSILKSDVFSGCRQLASVNIPAAVTEINPSTFEDCRSLKSITIPETVTSIGNGAFRGCSSLQSITLPSTIRAIYSNAFKDCISLTSFTIPDSVTYIYSRSFEGCTGLRSITIPESVTFISSAAFKNCTSLSSVTLPSSVTTIKGYAFNGCTSISTIVYDTDSPLTSDANVFSDEVYSHATLYTS